jgi:hypothetical protein
MALLGMDIPITGRVILMSKSSKRAGECSEASTRLALWMGDDCFVGYVSMALSMTMWMGGWVRNGVEDEG